MRNHLVSFASLLALCAAFLLPAGSARADEEAEGFRWLFNGKTLEGWEGNPEFWSVEDGGSITGRTTAEKPTKGNTFLIWRGGTVGDFELRLQIQMDGGNSGIQYRSEELADNKWVIKGYQADFAGDSKYTGILYEEKGRGILANRGTKVKIPTGGKPEVIGTTVDEKEILAAIKPNDWNDYTIIAQGNHLIHKINGVTTVDVVRTKTPKRGRRRACSRCNCTPARR